jgi:hypothetical protein
MTVSQARKCFGASGLSFFLDSWTEGLKSLPFLFGHRKSVEGSVMIEFRKDNRGWWFAIVTNEITRESFTICNANKAGVVWEQAVFKRPITGLIFALKSYFAPSTVKPFMISQASNDEEARVNTLLLAKLFETKPIQHIIDKYSCEPPFGYPGPMLDVPKAYNDMIDVMQKFIAENK